MTSGKSSTQALIVSKESTLWDSYFHRLLLSLLISDRLFVARSNCRHTKLTSIVCYAPTNSETRSDDVANKNAFYNQLDDLTSNIPKHDVHIVKGNIMNAQLGNDTSSWSPVFGNHAEGDLNENDIRLLSLGCRHLVQTHLVQCHLGHWHLVHHHLVMVSLCPIPTLSNPT